MKSSLQSSELFCTKKCIQSGANSCQIAMSFTLCDIGHIEVRLIRIISSKVPKIIFKGSLDLYKNLHAIKKEKGEHVIMTIQMILCLAILIFMMLGYVFGKKFKISNGAVAMMAILMIDITGILPSKTIVADILTSNSIQIICMFIIAAGFSRTQAVKKVTQLVYKVSGGRFTVMLAGYAILTFALVNLGLLPTTAFAIVGPLAVCCCDDFNVSPSKMIFPLALVDIAGCGVVPLSVAATTYASQNAYLESYGYTDYAMTLLDPMKGRLPIALMIMIYAIFFAPKLCPDQPSAEINIGVADAKKKNKEELPPLSPVREALGYIIFAVVTFCLIFQSQLGDIKAWEIAFAGATIVMFTGVLTPKEGIKAIPMRIILMLAAAGVVGGAMVECGLGEVIGDVLAALVGNTRNGYIIGGMFFFIPFIMTQFMNNTSVGQIFTPIVILTCQSLHCNPVGPLLLLFCARQSAFWTPASTGTIALAVGLGGYDQKDLIKMSWIPSLIIGIFGVLWIMTIFPAYTA